MAMIRNLLLPQEGGGSLRRFLGMRERLFRDQWNDSRILRGPVPLFDFRRRDDEADVRDALRPDRGRSIFGGWRVSDDGVIGGYSSSRMELVEGVRQRDGEDDAEGKCGASSSSSSPPFLRWSGTISTQVNRRSQLARNVTRSGFAAILSPDFPFSAPLGNKYKALEICCRTDGRTYAVNLRVDTYFPDDMYQGFIVGGEGGRQQKQQQNANGKERNDVNVILKSAGEIISETPTIRHNGEIESTPKQSEQLEQSLDVRKYIKTQQNIINREDPNNHPYHGHPPTGFQRFLLPFRDFSLTSRGRMRNQQRNLDGSISIESIGFTLMDGKKGDFCFDLVSMRAVNVMAGEVVGTMEEDENEEKLRRSLKSEGKEEEPESEKSEMKS